MPEFFLELFSEEIPARFQAEAADELLVATARIFQALDAGAEPRTFYGPRRVAITTSLAGEKPGGVLEFRGPRKTAPDAALNGFLSKHDARRDEVLVEGGYHMLRRRTTAKPARHVIEAELPEALNGFRWSKSMRWGQSGSFAWVRPLRRMICLLDGEVVPITLGPVIAGNETEGHRSSERSVFSVRSCADWESKLRDCHVYADQGARVSTIMEGLKEIAAGVGASLVPDDGLVQEVAGLVEWPVPLIGKIDQRFMSLPPEVRELSMKNNQKYFALRDAEGRPAPFFAFVGNLEAPDGGAAIIKGNERVLRARLADARHFWDLDLQTSLDTLLPKLAQITFHAKIGTQAERARRIAGLAREIAETLGADGHTARQAEWAGQLAKADLVTGMVGEFPELQGIMGGYYAERNSGGWDGATVGLAIKAHYQPKGPTEDVPHGNVAISVALADKIDTLREFFRIGEVPTGSGDPYALRRAALGVIRIILENDLRLPLGPLLAGDDTLLGFIRERLRVKLRGEGRRYDVLDAVLGVGGDDDLARIMRRVDALSDFVTTEDGRNLLVSFRRADNILKIEDAKDGPHKSVPLEGLLDLPEEKELNQLLGTVMIAAILEYREENYYKALTALATSRAVVDAFFDKVTINAPEPELRLNRLRLLAGLRDTVCLIADFSKIQDRS